MGAVSQVYISYIGMGRDTLPGIVSASLGTNGSTLTRLIYAVAYSPSEPVAFSERIHATGGNWTATGNLAFLNDW